MGLGFCSHFTVWPLASYLTGLSLRFLMYNIYEAKAVMPLCRVRVNIKWPNIHKASASKLLVEFQGGNRLNHWSHSCSLPKTLKIFQKEREHLNACCNTSISFTLRTQTWDFSVSQPSLPPQQPDGKYFCIVQKDFILFTPNDNLY